MSLFFPGAIRRRLGFALAALASAATAPGGESPDRFPAATSTIAGIDIQECRRSSFCRYLLAKIEAERNQEAEGDRTVILTGTAEEVSATLTRWHANGSLRAPMAAAARDADARFDAWIVTQGSPAALAGHVPDPTVSAAMKGEVAGAIEQVSGGIRFGPAVLIAGEAIARSEKDAATLAEVMRFMLTLAEFHSSPIVGLMDLARRAELSVQGNQVRLSLSLPAADFEKQAGAFTPTPATPTTR